MPSSYPTTLDSFKTTWKDESAPGAGDGDTILAGTDNNHADAINKIEAELGTDPSGNWSSVAARLDDLLGGGVAAPTTVKSTDTANIQAAINAAGPLGPVFLQEGTYNVGPLTGPVGALIGAGPGLTTIQASSVDGDVFTQAGSVGASVALTADAHEFPGSAQNWSARIHPNSTTGISPGDYLLIGSTAQVPLTIFGVLKGEIVRVLTVDSATQLTLASKLHDDYLVADGAFIKKITFTGPTLIEGITFRNTTPDQGAGSAIDASWCRDLRVHDCKFEALDGRGVSLDHCLDPHVVGCTFENLTDNTTASRYGYGVDIAGATQGAQVIGCTTRKARHAITTNATGATNGVPRHALIADCVASDCTAAAFDTHELGEYITFADCVAQGGDVTDGYGFQVRTHKVTLLNCVAENNIRAGILIREATEECTVIGGRVANTKFDSASDGHGIRVSGSKHSILGVAIENPETDGIHVYADGSNVVVAHCRVRNVGASRSAVHMDSGAGAVHVKGLYAEDCANGVWDAGSTGSQIDGLTGRNVTNMTNVPALAKLRVGTAPAATTLGTLSKKIEMFDLYGNSLGFVPVYATIT